MVRVSQSFNPPTIFKLKSAKTFRKGELSGLYRISKKGFKTRNLLCFQIIKKTFDYPLLYSDFDSLSYEIRGEDFYPKIAKNPVLQNHLDLSKCQIDHPFHSETNKMITLKFKDEMAGKIIRESIGLKLKTYSIVSESSQIM